MKPDRKKVAALILLTASTTATQSRTLSSKDGQKKLLEELRAHSKPTINLPANLIAQVT